MYDDKAKEHNVLSTPNFDPVAIADIRSRPIEWLWQNRIARAKLHVIGGDPGVGKSYLSLDIAARISTGRAWPDYAKPTQPENVILISAEDSIGDVIRPRLDKLGADLSKIHVIGPINSDEDTIAPVSMIHHLPAIESAIENHSASLLIIDPLLAFTDVSTDINRTSHVRRLLLTLANLAHTRDCAIIGIMHLNKRSAEGNALYRITASLDFVAAARSVILVGADPSDPRGRVMAHAKSNLAAVPHSLAFRLTDGGALEWTGPSHTTASILIKAKHSPDVSALSEAIDFLQNVLADGPMPAREVAREANELAISPNTLKRVRKALGIRTTRRNCGVSPGQGRWILALNEIQGAQIDCV